MVAPYSKIITTEVMPCKHALLLAYALKPNFPIYLFLIILVLCLQMTLKRMQN